jgi:hypothetical protein
MSVFYALLLSLAGCGLGAAFLPECFRVVATGLIGILAFSLSVVVVTIIRFASEDNT